ncbi:sigma-54 dependent transcriptional regulator [Muricauda ruestringensis]|jgi:DNA-binding NtrC family response regulator|uniref:Acetoacetate metabolism regulatory protein AtoC n=1 Tax=Flagellimonas marinaquae TaxID=254955 RepID=A0AA48HCD1_9FLAO|nr:MULTISPECIES: sigma-54 dependent transcriptional regulator [Allomuricauda]MCA0957597.1 sigma-54 dependent transcriptional regulator [Allomuricauda ruestringensis]USD24480.1 sigma-54 dependent transcriptional regulator [Allomuricauda aquimarina]BDW93517.1 acetoacetate metabolism regulatory protein AtoC [Allomuricauda aquimarina]
MALHKENILIVDDDIGILELLTRRLKDLNFHVFKAISVKEAVFILKDTPIDLLITDIQMPEVDGVQLLKFANEHYPNMPKLVVTGYPSVDGALEVVKSGAMDYLTKPFTKEELKTAVDRALSQGRKTDKPSSSATKIRVDAHFKEMVGESVAFDQVKTIVDRVKNNRATVLINGESGTGKELVARAIHYSGKYAKKPFVAVNCGAIPENLQEAELFGYTKGAFTGADQNRDGFFQAASGGTLFLDEIGTASLDVQTKLLRALQEKEITKVGSRTVEKIELRIVAATNVDLVEEIRKKNFREDLYYRLTVVEINVPPLRDRKSDIPLLVDKFLQKYGIEYRDRFVRIDPDALNILERYDWPGNIRELENVIQRAVIMADGHISIKDLPDYLKYEIQFPEDELIPLKEMEKRYIQKVLAHTEGNKTKAAEILQITRKTLRDKLD